jgi:hypothetical protein
MGKQKPEDTKKKDNFSISMTTKLRDKINKQADKEGRNRSQMIECLVERGLGNGFDSHNNITPNKPPPLPQARVPGILRNRQGSS